jgi:hypothetical protein
METPPSRSSGKEEGYHTTGFPGRRIIGTERGRRRDRGESLLLVALQVVFPFAAFLPLFSKEIMETDLPPHWPRVTRWVILLEMGYFIGNAKLMAVTKRAW